jgi:hypothetical protein
MTGTVSGPVIVTEPPQKGVHRQYQFERFLTKREYNQYT